MTGRVSIALAALSMLMVATVAADEGRSRQFDASRTQALFKVGMRLPLRIEGRFERTEGELETRPGGNLRVHARLDGRLLRMKGADWMRKVTLSSEFLDVQRHPEIAFESEEFEATRLAAGGRLHGRLKLRGQQRDVRFELLPAACARPGDDCDIRVRGRLNRHDFGMNSHRVSVRSEISFEFHIRLAAASP